MAGPLPLHSAEHIAAPAHRGPPPPRDNKNPSRPKIAGWSGNATGSGRGMIQPSQTYWRQPPLPPAPPPPLPRMSSSSSVATSSHQTASPYQSTSYGHQYHSDIRTPQHVPLDYRPYHPGSSSSGQSSDHVTNPYPQPPPYVRQPQSAQPDTGPYHSHQPIFSPPSQIIHGIPPHRTSGAGTTSAAFHGPMSSTAAASTSSQATGPGTVAASNPDRPATHNQPPTAQSSAGLSSSAAVVSGAGASSDEDEDGMDEKQKLEVRREKNRVKQRNLRMRRANHVTDLESTLQSLRTEHSVLQSALDEVERRQVDLHQYASSLETLLQQRGLLSELDELRRQFAPDRPIGAADGGGGGDGVDRSLDGRKRRKVDSGAVPSTVTPAAHQSSYQATISAAAGDLPGQQPPPALPQQPVDPFGVDFMTAPSPSRSIRIEDLLSPYLDSSTLPLRPVSQGQNQIDIKLEEPMPLDPVDDNPASLQISLPMPLLSGPPAHPIGSIPHVGLGLELMAPNTFGGLTDISGVGFDLLSTTLGPAGAAAVLGYNGYMTGGSGIGPSAHLPLGAGMAIPSVNSIPTRFSGSTGWMADLNATGSVAQGAGSHDPGLGGIFGPASSVAMVKQDSNGSSGSGGSGSSAGASKDINAVERVLDPVQVAYGTLPPFLAVHNGPTVTPIGQPNIHPSLLTARALIRALLASQSHLPITQCILPPLTPQHQTIILHAIYNLTSPAVRDAVNASQVRNLPPLYLKILMNYSTNSRADARIVLLPIAILRGRIVEFLETGHDFDVTAFISHVLADARVYGDTADPDAWEMSNAFWDVWGGWFKNGRRFCNSLSGWRRRAGNAGSTVLEVLMGLEREGARMKELVGRPPGWKMSDILQPQGAAPTVVG